MKLLACRECGSTEHLSQQVTATINPNKPIDLGLADLTLEDWFFCFKCHDETDVVEVDG